MKRAVNKPLDANERERRDKRHRALVRGSVQSAAPVLRALRSIGFEVNSIADIMNDPRVSGLKERPRLNAAAADLLLEHLAGPYHHLVKQDIVRVLTGFKAVRTVDRCIEVLVHSLEPRVAEAEIEFALRIDCEHARAYSTRDELAPFNERQWDEYIWALVNKLVTDAPASRLQALLGILRNEHLPGRTRKYLAKSILRRRRGLKVPASLQSELEASLED